MKTRYSKTTGTFYPFEIDYGDNLPADVVEVPIEDYQAAMTRPVGYTFDFVDGQLVISAPVVDLSTLKAQKTAEITQARLAADADHFVYQGKAIRTAEKDMNDLLVSDARISKGVGMPPNWPGGWKAVDNSFVQIASVDEWNAFFTAMYDAGIANFMHSQDLKAKIAAATTPEEVNAITW